MRKLWLMFGLMLPAVLCAGTTVNSVLRREAGKCAAAWQREDFSTMVSYLPARVVQQLGGRATLVNELKGHFADARRLGAQRLEALPGTPSAPQKIGPWFVAVVPLTAVVRSALVDLTQETHALAVSADQGKRWSFVLLYGITQAELDAWFPEFRGRVRVPVPPKPQLTLAN